MSEETKVNETKVNEAKNEETKSTEVKSVEKKNNKTMIAIIAALSVVIIVLVVVLVFGGKNKNATNNGASTESVSNDNNTNEVNSETDGQAAIQNETTEKQEDAATQTADCYAEVNYSNGWESNGSYCGQLDAKIYNKSGKELSNWKIEIDAVDGVKVDSSWNGTYEIKDNIITITPAEYNGQIAANSTLTDLGFIVSAKSEADVKSLTNNVRLYINNELYTSADASSTADVENDSKEDEKQETTTEQVEAEEERVPESGTPYDNHGKLSVSGTDLVDQNGDKYQLKGVSTHGIAWFPEYVNKDAIQTFRDDWGANLIRIAMYSDENMGYCSGGDQAKLKGLVDTGVQAAAELGMYVIVDWHVLGDQNPQVHKEEAKAFFDEVTKKYANYGNVIYEICNEPNGGTTWADVKSYAEEVIPVIRANAPDAIIIIGTPNWSQDVDLAAADPVKGYDNLMYAIHFYAATHTDWLRTKATNAMSSGLPIFVSEFSICDASGNGAIDYGQADQWFDLINQYNLSYAAWNVSNKAETSSLIKSSCTKTSGWTEDDLSETGVWIRKQILGK